MIHCDGCGRDLPAWIRFESHRCHPIVCVCESPVLGPWNECQLCFRKPAALLGVLGPATVEAVA